MWMVTIQHTLIVLELNTFQKKFKTILAIKTSKQIFIECNPTIQYCVDISTLDLLIFVFSKILADFPVYSCLTILKKW